MDRKSTPIGFQDVKKEGRMDRRRMLAVVLVCIAGLLGAEEIALPVPFAKGEATPVAGWRAGTWSNDGRRPEALLQGTGADTSVRIPAGCYLEFAKGVRAHAGDRVFFEIEWRSNRPCISVDLNQWAEDGNWVSLLNCPVRGKPDEVQTRTGELILKDSEPSAGGGAVRKVGRFNLSVHCPDSPGAWLEVRKIRLNIDRAEIRGAEEIPLPVPFAKGETTPIAGWKAGTWSNDGRRPEALLQGTGKDTSVRIPAGCYLEFDRSIRASAGDRAVFEIEWRSNRSTIFVNLGQWAEDGYWVSQLRCPLKGTPDEFQTMDGELTLRDNEQPDERGVIRRVGKFKLSVHCPGDDPDGWLEVKSMRLKVERRPEQ